MDYAKHTVNEILNHIKNVSSALESAEVRKMMNSIVTAKRVFVYGMGRSGLIAKAFGMRLANLDIPVYVVGEVTTPAIKKGDFIFLISGSGNTKSVVNAAVIAKEVGAKVGSLTSNPVSELTKLSDICIMIPGRTKEDVEDLKKDYFINQLRGKHIPYSPLGTLFEDTCLILLDSAIVQIMHDKGKSEKDLRERHPNIE